MSYPPTQLLFWEDTYLFETAAKVLDVNINEKFVVLDKTVCYPSGGGQPTDTGSISTSNNTTFPITLAKLHDRTTVLHFLDKEPTFNIGDDVVVKIDKEKRELHAKLHSAGHLLDSALIEMGVDYLVPDKGYHYPDGPYVEYIGKIPAEQKEEIRQKLEVEANRLIHQGMTVGKEMADAERVEKLCGSFPPYLSKDSHSRVVFVGGLWCPCGGTHVKDVKEIGGMKITKLRVQKDRTRISYIIV